jgi:hypothetical protein
MMFTHDNDLFTKENQSGKAQSDTNEDEKTKKPHPPK